MKSSIRPRLVKQLGIRTLIACYLWAGSSGLFADEGRKSTDNAKNAQASEPVGCPLAPGMIALLEDEIKEGLKRREIETILPSSSAMRPVYSITQPTAVGRKFGQRSAKLVRQVVSQPAESHGGGRTIHAEATSGCLG